MMGNELQKISTFRYKVAIAETWEELSKLDNIGAAIQEFAKREKLSHEKQNEIGLVRVELEQKKGAWLDKNFPQGARPGEGFRTHKSENVNIPRNLRKFDAIKLTMPIRPWDSTRARHIANAPKEELSEAIDAIINSDDVITPQKVYKVIKQKENEEARKERERQEAKKYSPTKPTIIKADCISIINKIGPIDLLIADPPYFTDGDFTGHVSAFLKRVKATGQAYVFLSASPEEVGSYLSMESYHMKLEQVLIWCYNNTGQRQPNERYTSNYQIYFYYRGPHAPNINKPADGKEQYACQVVNAPDGRIGDRYHKWQKPVELIERLIRNSSNPDDFIFDPFAGSGTTMVAAAKLGRKSIGCDIDEEAVKICVDRGCEIGE